MFDLLIYRLLNYKIVNGVAPLATGTSIDLNKIELACKKHKLSYLRYPKFSGLRVKFDYKNEENIDLNFTGLFFKSGKINLIGLKEDTPEYLKSVTDLLSLYQVDMFGAPILKNCTKRIANRVYSLKIPALIDLSQLHLFNRIKSWKNIKYNSEAFPGAVIKFNSFKSRALCFRTGSIIITGIVSTNCKKNVLLELIEIICEYLEVKNQSFSYTNA